MSPILSQLDIGWLAVFVRTLLTRLILAAEESLPFATAQMHPAFGAVEDVSHPDAVFGVRVQASHFQLNPAAICVLHRRHLCVRRLLVAIENIVAAHALDTLWMFVLLKGPTRDVGIVRAVIAGLAIPGVPEPVPVVMKSSLVERAPGRWPHPEVVVDSGRNGAVGLAAQRLARPENDALHH